VTTSDTFHGPFKVGDWVEFWTETEIILGERYFPAIVVDIGAPGSYAISPQPQTEFQRDCYSPLNILFRETKGGELVAMRPLTKAKLGIA